MLLLLASCSSTDIEPFVDAEAPYTIWGFLDPNAAEQHIRVIPIRRQAENIESARDASARLDAQVVLTDLETDFRQVWQQSLRANADSSRLFHVFSAPTQLLYEGQRHRIEIINLEGEVVTSAETTIPPFNENAPIERGTFRRNAEGDLIQRISFPEIGQPYKLLVIYNEGTPFSPIPFGVYYDQQATQDENGLWGFDLNLTRDAENVTRQIMDRFGEVSTVRIISMEVRLSIPDPTWAELERLQSDGQIPQPGAYSNVVNGFGYFGSIGVYRSVWDITREEGEQMGFVYATTNTRGEQ
ncbi:MAG: hypothetical protein RhofKO_28840 [Rhodothermales bacterium]